MISLDIFFDPMCAWCYIGKSRLDRALEANADHPFDLTWHPYQLNPTMPQEGMAYAEYMKAKFHGQDGALKVMTEMQTVFDAEIPQAKLSNISRVPNTLNAHRVMHWAALDECQSRVASGLFKAYFQEGLNLNDLDVLADIASKAGMDRAATLRLLQGDIDIDTVQQRDKHARERGINAVPLYIVANQHAVSGAQPTELWQNVIDEIKQQI